MKAIKLLSLVIVAFVFTSINVYSQENQDQLPAKEKWSLVTIEGTITAIVKDTREITVRGPEGNLLTMTAGDAVERFDEIAVGDVIAFDYWKYIMAEFRSPTAEELAEPLVVLAEGGKAPEGMDPAAVVGALVKAVVTVEVLNRPEMTATVKGPRGNYMTFDMEDQSLLQKLNVGQSVIMTYAEAMALSLRKITADKE